jgi:hypothetical protein
MSRIRALAAAPALPLLYPKSAPHEFATFALGDDVEFACRVTLPSSARPFGIDDASTGATQA